MVPDATGTAATLTHPVLPRCPLCCLRGLSPLSSGNLISRSADRFFLAGNKKRFVTFIEFKKHLVPLECTSQEFLDLWENGNVTVGAGTALLWIE